MNRRNKQGPYRVTHRYWGAGRDVGRIYEAYNEGTGAPAVVVVPGAAKDWWPRGNWKLTMTAGCAPPRLTMELSGRVRPEDLVDLPGMMARMGVAAADVLARPDGAEHLADKHGRRVRATLRDRRVRSALQVAACLLAMAAGALAVAVHRAQPELREEVAAEPTGFTYTAGQLPMAPMPAAPFERQKRPPCEPTLEDEMRGGCWTRLNLTAPCPAKAYEGDGKCYLPALAEAKPGQSVRP